MHCASLRRTVVVYPLYFNMILSFESSRPAFYSVRPVAYSTEEVNPRVAISTLIQLNFFSKLIEIDYWKKKYFTIYKYSRLCRIQFNPTWCKNNTCLYNMIMRSGSRQWSKCKPSIWFFFRRHTGTNRHIICNCYNIYWDSQRKVFCDARQIIKKIPDCVSLNVYRQLKYTTQTFQVT